MLENLRNDTKNIETKTLQNTQLKFYKVMAVPMLTYTSENRSNKKKIESAEMKFYFR
jgi:hypothetical protein